MVLLLLVVVQVVGGGVLSDLLGVVGVVVWGDEELVDLFVR